MLRSTRRRLGLLAALAALAGACPAAAAQQVVIYRCTDAAGALTVQNDEACPAGTRQERTVIEPPPPMPVYVPQTPAPAPREAQGAAQAPATTAAKAAPERPDAPAPARIADADRLPPPPIFRCHTPGNDRYVSEDVEPKPRCVPLQTVGINGDPGLAAGAACEWQYDRCERIPDGEACDGWRQRGREIESTWRYARGEARGPLQDAFARVSTILSDTTCGLPEG
ncbi:MULTISPECIES: DUF4124 domain-containing protein [unclassified Luteimonas]|uniref:DUF4124 domain-containing protein n=1 Tax=unclassified Luteimonas TaxID=2629088 RepID=UPI0018F0D586|nr:MULTISPECIES: DUF4124 domain-containing protein [unclassified Luteimonas]MBJ6979031.1 DUF4124 domain-containing protein [Luteimonas sp. MC1895]MBJ6985047.1 DUF4124 domain-containing protein [Luteimonas sp. MC1750]QQO05713.1 DUF4124 domain-containing protein [Luteimonas sp. MC1750]